MTEYALDGMYRVVLELRTTAALFQAACAGI